MTVARGTTVNVDWTLNESASTASLTCTLPSAMAAGKLLTAHVVASTSSPGLPGTGSWQWASGSPLGTNNEVLTGLAYTTDPAAGLAFTQATAGRMMVILTVYGGEDPLTVIDVTPTTNNVITQSMTLTGITTVTDGDMLVSGCGINASTITTITQPSGFALIARNTSGTGKGGAYADLGQAVQGATGNEIWTNDAVAGTRQCGYLAAIRAAVSNVSPDTQVFIPRLSNLRLLAPTPMLLAGNVAHEFGAGATTVPLADTGVGDDTLAVTASTPLADTGASADAVAVSAAVPITDAGSAADAIAVVYFIGLADAGAGTDAIAVTAAIPLANGGSAADALAETVATPLADAGSAADSAAVSAAVPISDVASASETLAAGVPIAVTETGSAFDALSLTITVALADAGSAAESRSVAATVPLTDAGSAADVLGVLVPLALAEAAAAADALSVQRVVALADTGTAADSITASQQTSSNIALADTATASDRICAILHRVTTGTQTRPDGGITTRPSGGTQTRPGGGNTTTRPYSGVTYKG